MEQIKAQKRMLACAAFFSFGSLSGALFLFRLSPSAAEHIAEVLSYFYSISPLLFIPLISLFGPFLVLFLKPCAIGAVIICVITLLMGFIAGFSEFLSIRNGFYPVVTAAFLALYSFCFLQIGSCFLRSSLLSRRLVFRSGLSNPDQAFDSARVLCAFFVLLLASFAFSVFVLRA